MGLVIPQKGKIYIENQNKFELQIGYALLQSGANHS
jgi:hypothetical protein